MPANPGGFVQRVVKWGQTSRNAENVQVCVDVDGDVGAFARAFDFDSGQRSKKIGKFFQVPLLRL